MTRAERQRLTRAVETRLGGRLTLRERAALAGLRPVPGGYAIGGGAVVVDPGEAGLAALRGSCPSTLPCPSPESQARPTIPAPPPVPSVEPALDLTALRATAWGL